MSGPANLRFPCMCALLGLSLGVSRTGAHATPSLFRRITAMEPAQIILLAIAAIGLLLLALLFYLLVLMPKERGPRPPEVTQAPQPPVHETEPAPRAPLTHIPGMDSVHQHDGAAA